MSLQVGEVIGVHGTRVTIKIFDDSNKETIFFGGQKHKGVSVREHVSVQRGFREIICIVEGEYLDEQKTEIENGKVSYIRKVESKPIGYIEDGEFHRGIKFLPMIKDAVHLLAESNVQKIYSAKNDPSFTIGKLLKEETAIALPWEHIFNSHVGIFGNTGSGKSNTLAKLFTLLFEQKIDGILGKSNFVIFDFNGEYTNQQITGHEHKSVRKLNTRAPEDKIGLSDSEFWDLETLSILFNATQNTQRPFLNRVLAGRLRFIDIEDSLARYIQSTFRRAFSEKPARGEVLSLLRRMAEFLGHEPLVDFLNKIEFNNSNGQLKTIVDGEHVYFDTDAARYAAHLEPLVNSIDTSAFDAFDELVVRTNLMLVRDLIFGTVQFEHIQPLLKRMDSAISGLRNILEVTSEDTELKLVTVVSLRRCNQEMKKVVPLLIAKHFYNHQKNRVTSPPQQTMHLVIDEAHNILSQQSVREREIWKDYRLELFEEIIKEGRKFGVFLTLASQRPADISPTIVSQVHNFFLHRLVNERDLFLLENTISSLDALSRSQIPNLAKGCCVVTGTAFDLPMLIQVERLPKSLQPDRADVPLKTLWD